MELLGVKGGEIASSSLEKRDHSWEFEKDIHIKGKFGKNSPARKDICNISLANMARAPETNIVDSNKHVHKFNWKWCHELGIYIWLQANRK